MADRVGRIASHRSMHRQWLGDESAMHRRCVGDASATSAGGNPGSASSRIVDAHRRRGASLRP
eukprot:4985618-Pyramimonas_sp.AAC.1